MGRTTYNPIPPMACEKIIKSVVNDIRVSNKANKKLSDILLARAEEIAQKAADIAKHSGRKTIKEGDIELAIK